MNCLAMAIIYECKYQKLRRHGGYPITRAWCMESLPFLIEAINFRMEILLPPKEPE